MQCKRLKVTKCMRDKQQGQWMAEKAFERTDKKIREKWQRNIEYRQKD